MVGHGRLECGQDYRVGADEHRLPDPRLTGNRAASTLWVSAELGDSTQPIRWQGTLAVSGEREIGGIVSMPYEYLDHEADIGLEATGASLEEALQDGVRGLLALLVDPETVEPRETVTVQARGEDPGSLYVALLNAVLAAVDLHRMFFRDFELTHLAQVDDHLVVEGKLYGEPIDLGRHAVEIEVKAATYGGLLAERTDSGWRLRCVLDL
ncbi:MAG: archease [Thermomicrobium sp.]|nr:archease [Thermomicrobium sp.]MDW8060547.1 archease [Thermomicrobium sp.]